MTPIIIAGVIPSTNFHKGMINNNISRTRNIARLLGTNGGIKRQVYHRNTRNIMTGYRAADSGARTRNTG